MLFQVLSAKTFLLMLKIGKIGTLFFSLALGLAYPLGTLGAFTLECNGTNVMVHKSDSHFDVFPLRGLNGTSILEKKIISHIPEFVFQVTMQRETTELGYCGCAKQLKIKQSVSLNKDRLGRFEAPYQVIYFQGRHTSIDKDGLSEWNFRKCQNINQRMQEPAGSRALRSLGFKLSPLDDQIVQKVKRFEPKHTCKAPFEFVHEAKMHFGELWKKWKTDNYIDALVSEDVAKQFCETHCARKKPDGMGSCKLTDLQ